MKDEGNFTRIKKFLAIVTGLAIAAISAYNSKNGFVSGDGDALLSWMGWVFSVACMAAQFMFTSEFRKLNWTVIVLGSFAYLYSIPTNYIGLQDWNGVATEHNFVNAIAAAFMDIYPEAAVAWAMGESKLGDMIGNLVRTIQRRDDLTDTSPRRSEPRYEFPPSNPVRPYAPYHPQPDRTPLPPASERMAEEEKKIARMNAALRQAGNMGPQYLPKAEPIRVPSQLKDAEG